MEHDIQKIDGVIPQELFDSISQKSKLHGFNYGWYSSRSEPYGHWNFQYARTITKNGLDVSRQLYPDLLLAWQHVQQLYFPDMILARCYISQHTYGTDGYPHTDSTRDNSKTLVVYLNQEWRPEWAGETVIFQDGEIVCASLPKANRGLIFPGNRLHVARSPSRVCPVARTTLMFKAVIPDPLRDRIQRFLAEHKVDQIPHSGRTLADHLLQTYDLLKNAGQSDAVCSAGALHSIFGTNIFKIVTIPLSDKHLVVDLVGQAAADLIEEFSQIDRPALLESSVIREQNLELCTIEAANLVEQNNLSAYPNLEKYWQQLNKT